MGVRYKFEVGQRVLYTALFDNRTPENSGNKVLGTVIAAFGEPPVYRVELDTVWDERIPRLQGKQMVVGNVLESLLSPVT